VTIANNQTARSIGIDGDTALTLSGNTFNVAVADGGAAALSAWALVSPQSAAQVALISSAALATPMAPPVIPMTPVAPMTPAAPMADFHIQVNFMQNGWAFEL
jgi:hypothetical protein